MDERTVRKTFKYKLRPTAEQEGTMAFVVRRCRELYNAGLQERRDAWQQCGVSITAASQRAQLPDIKDLRPEYRDIHSQVLQDVLARLDKAYQAFFRRVQAGEQPGYPRFRGGDRYHSFTYKVPVQPLPPTDRETGRDVGLKVFLVTADGQVVENPRHYRREEQRLKKAQRVVSRRKKGSNRRRKAVKVLARKHQKVRRQRQDFHHKIALALIRAYDTIYLEELRVRNMVRNHHLAKSISDAGWAAFRTTLEYKAACAGKQVIAIEPAYTSQDGSGCGARIQKSLSVRTHVCTSCGLVLDRDENAARNIQRLGQSRRGAVA